MKVLFIGGTGIISSACTEAAVAKGMEVFHLNRGITNQDNVPKEVTTIYADIRNGNEAEAKLNGHYFDAVVDFIAFEPQHIAQDIQLFRDCTAQFVFISTASAYQKPPEKLPITEKTPLWNPYWEYSKKKIFCEKLLKSEAKKSGFPFTIVRPSHTYNYKKVPAIGGYTVLHRMLKGQPVVLHGDGTSVWTLTYHRDFAVGLIGLLGNRAAIHEDFHITSDEWLTWNGIYKILANELGVEPKTVHVPSEIIALYDKEMGANLLGDKSHSMIFDNSKIKKFVPEFQAKTPFSKGATEIVQWFRENTLYTVPDAAVENWMNRLIDDWEGFKSFRGKVNRL
jgi:nucleoside-diphosphate-sugar epimerase